ncbi:hypothetical protein GQ43DRAFT_437946 [Delitschia confertaspora ATCC 74209]|uniref:Uncharacterized protein n=1 Tax=Delitschia confertaspora ATCC 74209 TaxID=1513339 RepID=A0A9P4JRK4_9PLEO|nr:hypothetical protein GQ43DRAFT_437946 [Delitschia confertaspora ATCC 74209]
MGGNAFLKHGPGGEPPLNVPRMNQELYAVTKHQVQQKLQVLYSRTAVPREAPGKIDHGDIDFLVERPLIPITPEEVAEKLSAVRYVKNGDSYSYAIEHPTELNTHIQVDIELVDLDIWDWTLFQKSDSDFLQILGIIHRDLGLTFNNKGLHVRIEEIEPFNRKESLIFLTSDPLEALTFIGLDPCRFQDGYAEEDEMFKEITRGKFFNRAIFEDRIKKSNDRQRMRKRDMYRRFIEEWLPVHPKAGNSQGAWTRQQVIDAALFHFNKRNDYDEKITEYTVWRREVHLWEQIGQRIPVEGNSNSKRTAIRGLKYWVEFKDGQPKFRDTPLVVDSGRSAWAAAFCQNDSLFNPDNTLKKDAGDVALRWAEKNWMKAKELEKKRVAANKGRSTS